MAARRLATDLLLWEGEIEEHELAACLEPLG
jgi:hypothetical protein